MTKRSWMRSRTAPRDPSLRRKERLRKALLLEILEARIAPSVTVVFNASTNELDVSLSAANDQSLISASATGISVSGTGLTSQSFTGVASLIVQGSNTASADVPNQVVDFAGGGGTFALHTAAGTDALGVSGVTAANFTNVTFNVTSGNIDVNVAEKTEADSTGIAGTGRAAGLGQPHGGAPHGGQRRH